MTKKIKVSTLGIFTTLLLSTSSCGCGNRASTMETPKATLAKTIQENTSEELFDKTKYIPTDWWVLFEDEQLSTFITTTFRQNPTLDQAYANIRLANSNVHRLRANLFPSIFLGGDVSREKLSETALIPFNNTTGGATPTNSATAAAITTNGGIVPPLPTGNKLIGTGGAMGIPVYFTQYETEVALSYDFDIWNKNRNAWRAAISEYYANIADEAFIRLQLGISVAQVYYQLQIDYKRAEIAQKLIDNQARYSELIQRKKEGNLENIQLVYNTLINVVSAKQALLQIQADITVNEYRLKTYLAGQFDEEIYNIQIDQYPLPKVPVPDDLPLHLIGHRPEIIAQLWLIESAGKQIEVAKAGFYPDFNLMAIFGYQTLHLEKLFNWKSSYYNVDPAFSLPIFDGGRLTANLRTSEINYDLAIYKYNSLVLNAVKEVLEGIFLLRNADLQLKETQNKVKQQEALLKLVDLRIQNNISSELDFLISQQAMLAAQDIEIVTLGNKIQVILSLIKALGGGYSNCYEEG